MKKVSENPELIEFTRVNKCVNGNPRYVCHYLNFKPHTDPDEPFVLFKYLEALNIAKELGGRKFNNKQYVGGVLFSSYNLYDLSTKIQELTGHAIVCHREPTKAEIKFGNGATHYRTFNRKFITKSNGELKKFFKSHEDGLYYSTK